MPAYDFQLSGAWPSGITSPDLDENFRDPGAPAPMSPQYNRRQPYDGPRGPAEVATMGSMPNQVYRRPTPTRTTTLGMASQVPVGTGDLMEAVAATQGSRHKRRGDLPREGAPSDKRVSKRRIAKKVGQACLRCRKYKQRCDGEKPRCRRCGQHRVCIYAPTQRQMALEQAAKDAEPAPDFSGQLELVDAALGETHSAAPRLRPILPRPEVPSAVVGGLVAGSDGQAFGTSEGPGGFWGAAAGGSYGFSQHTHQPGPMSQVMPPSPIGLPGYQDQAARAWGRYQPQLSGPYPALAVPNLALEGSMAPPNTMFQAYQRPGGDIQDYLPRALLPPFQGPYFALEGSMGWPSGNPNHYQQPEAEIEDYLPQASAPPPPFGGPGFVEESMGGPSGNNQYYQQLGTDFEGYPPRGNAPLPLSGGSGFVLGESTAPPNGIPQYRLGGYPAPVNAPWSSHGAPDLAHGVSVAQPMNSDLDTEYMFSDFPPPSTGDGLWPEPDGTGPNVLDEQAAARAHFAELDAMDLPGRQGG